jgi:hypothetical protein
MGINIRKIIESVNLDEGVLNEASFSASKLKKVSDLLAIVLGKQLGGEFKLLGGSLGQESFKKKKVGEGKGFKYMNKKGQMIRFGWLKNSKKSTYQINIVDFWDPRNGKRRWDTPTLSIQIADWLNIVEVVKELKDVIMNGEVPELRESLTEDFDIATMTKVPVHEGKVPNKLIQYAASKGVEYDPTVHTYSKKLMMELQDQELWDEDEYRGFKIVKDERESNSTEATFKAAEKKLAEKKWSDPDFVFDDIEKLTKIVAMGGANGLIVAGMAGLGKTFHVEKTMKELLGSPEGPTAKWRHRKGAKLSPFGLYMDLFINRDDKTIVYDDSDSVWSDKDAVNILKGAIDTYDVRQVEWPSRSTVNLELMDPAEKEEYLMNLETALREKPEDVGTKIKLPSKFDFTSRIIFITNMPAAKFDKDANMSAIKSRSFFMDVQLKREDIIYRIKSLLPFIEPDVDMKIKEEILEQLAKSEHTLTMRAVVAAIAIKKGGIPDWERLVREYA